MFGDSLIPVHGLKSIRKSKKQQHRSNCSTTCIFLCKKNVHSACGFDEHIRIRYGWHALIRDKWLPLYIISDYVMDTKIYV